MNDHFHSIFKRADSPDPRAKFLSRVFGIFSEDLVSLWAADRRAPYENLGRPTIKPLKGERGHTLDFTFRERATGRIFVAEMKCEIEYQNFRYFVLERPEQLTHHNKPAFDAFLKAAMCPSEQPVYVAGRRVNVDGAILVWGAATAEGRRAVIESAGFRDVLTIAEVCRDLSLWSHAGYRELIAKRQEWCTELFSGLVHGWVLP